MKLDNDLLTQINNYLDHKLTADDRQAFESQIAKDVALREEVNRQSIIREAVLRKEYKALFKQIHDELAAQEEGTAMRETTIQPEMPGRVVALRWHHWAMAASVVLLLGVGWFFFVKGPDADQLYTAHFSAQPKQPTRIPDPEIMGSSRIPSEQTDSIQVAQAIGLLQTDNTPKAAEALQKVAQESGNHWGRVAEWYLTLAYLKADERKKARKQLQSIIQDTNHPYYQDAATLLTELE